MLNKVIITGRLTAEPELRTGSSGTKYASFSIACERDYKGQNGERETDFFDVRAFKNTAEFIAKYFTKGSMIQLEGRLQRNIWQDKDGNTHRPVIIVAQSVYFCGSRKDGGAEAAGGAESGALPESPYTGDFVVLSDAESELPF